ncbi:MAG TPA: cell division protein FtsK, partial [Alphaproteobacteria bacterium]|nr:cell division protein FtsK [Alphaproteobacteria bacterium]
PDYSTTITEPGGDEDSLPGLGVDFASGGGDDEERELFNKAVDIVARDRKASTSYIQRKLSIGYNRAARIIEQMEEEGIVGSANHVGKREILVRDPNE